MFFGPTFAICSPEDTICPTDTIKLGETCEYETSKLLLLTVIVQPFAP